MEKFALLRKHWNAQYLCNHHILVTNIIDYTASLLVYTEQNDLPQAVCILCSSCWTQFTMDKSEISRANTVFKFVNFLWRIAKRRWFTLLIFHKHIHASYLNCFVTSWVQFYVLIVVGKHQDQKKTSSNLETKSEISLVTLCVAMLHVGKLCVEMRTAILVMVQPEAAKKHNSVTIFIACIWTDRPEQTV